VLSPIEGRANRHFVDIGNLVSQDTTLLTNIATGLITGLEVAPTAYRYTSFPELDQVIAIEVTTVVGMELP
jgi:hypothetical protein